MKRNLLVIFILFLFTLPATKSLFQQGAYTSHDLTHHIVRQIDMHSLLSQGQFPPRWSGNLASGYGYPLFIFNYPLPPLIGEVFYRIGFNFVDSVKAVFFLSFVVSTFGMFFFLRSLLNSYSASFLGAIFYLYAPIHLITVYVSGSPGAAMGLVFPPFIFWSIVKLWQKASLKFFILGTFSFAGMVLSHNISAFIFTPLILLFVFTLKLLGGKEENKGFFKNLGLMILLGLGLSAFFWLPALTEKQYIRYDQLMQKVYTDQFPTLKQIIYSPWGYGLSHPKQPEGGMSYQIGIAHIAVILVLTFFLWKYRKEKKLLFLGIFTIVPSILAVFFMTEASLLLWDNLPFLSYIQFPVRLLVVPIFCASIAAALLVKYLPWRVLLFSILLFLVLYANRNHLGINQKIDLGEEYYLSLQTSATSFDENLPKWVSKIKTEKPENKFTFLEGGGNIKILENKSHKVVAIVESSQSSKLRFNQYYFPNWTLKKNGENINFNYKNHIENNGLPVFDIEKGKHEIKAEFKNTLIRNIADTVSFLSVIIWGGILCKLLIRR